MLMPVRNRIFWLAAALMVATSAGAASAQSDKPSAFDPSFGSRIDKPDGSAAMTIGRRLPMAWETKVGTDVSLAAPEGTAASENLSRGAAPDRSSGSVWGNLTVPVLRPLGIDKTSVEARLDAGKDEGKLGATLSRSMPITQDLSVTLQNNYSVTRSLAGGTIATPGIPPVANVPAGIVGPSVPIWAADESVRFNVNPSGTTFSAGAVSSTVDAQWHNKLSIEQTLVGPLKVTTSVEDAGRAASNKSITAGFKRVW